MTILMAFQTPELEILGLTTIFGNVTTEDATRNALTLVCICISWPCPLVLGFYFSYFRFFFFVLEYIHDQFPVFDMQKDSVKWQGVQVFLWQKAALSLWRYACVTQSVFKEFPRLTKVNYWACTALGAFTKDRLLSCHLDDECWCYFICLMFLFSERSYVWQTNFLLTSSCNMPSRWSIVIFFWKFIATFLGLNVCGI